MNDKTVKKLFDNIHELECGIKQIVKEFQKENGFFVQAINIEKTNNYETCDFKIKVKINVEF